MNNNDATVVSKQPIVQSLNRGEVAARLNADNTDSRLELLRMIQNRIKLILINS